MPDQNRPTPFFLADDPALDFLNSIASPWGATIEWLEDGCDLLDWLRHAGLIGAGVVANFSDIKFRDRLDAVAQTARTLREDVRAVIATSAGRRDFRLPAELMQRLNEILALDHEVWELVADSPAQPVMHRKRYFPSPDNLLVPLAEIIARLVCDIGPDRVRLCQGNGCTLWFNDISKNHTRRWCSMAVCGNRAKAAAHRARQRGPK